MIDVRPFSSLGRFQNDWLNAHYHFSFANYVNPQRNGVGPLLVWNDDEIGAGGGFPKHGHRNMEIITYVRKGAITHEDHLGNRGRTEAGDVQVMTAGKGILHSEFNEEEETTTLFQIWIQPSETYLQPRWEQRAFPTEERHGRFVPLASGRAGHENALSIHQDAALLGSFLKKGESLGHALEPGRLGYLVVAQGSIELNGKPLGPRDAAQIENEERLEISALEDAEILLADLPALQ